MSGGRLEIVIMRIMTGSLKSAWYQFWGVTLQGIDSHNLLAKMYNSMEQKSSTKYMAQ